MKNLLPTFLFVVAVIAASTLRAQITPSIEWQKCFGGIHQDEAQSIQQTADGGYIVAGTTSSNDGNVTGNNGSFDYWIVKLDVGGNLIWQKALGGSNYENGNSIRQTFDGGYIAAGYSASNDSDATGNHGSED